MRRIALGVGWFVAAGMAAAVVLLAFTRGGSAHAPPTVSIEGSAQPLSAASGDLPATWAGRLHQNAGTTLLISCLDANHDGRLTTADNPAFAGLDFPFVRDKECLDPANHADYFEGEPSDPAAYSCDAPKPPLLVISIGGGGTDLNIASSGVSLGLLDIVNDIQSRAASEGIATLPVLAAGAVFDTDFPQTRMEQWIAHEVESRLTALPCLRAVLIGHSHGGVIVTAAMYALEDRFASRMYGVALDRSLALYDHPATQLPKVAPLLNVFQLNEGWHGIPLDQPNITNADASWAAAPFRPWVSPQPLATVTHLTLDDSPAVQQGIVDRVMAWADGAGS